MVGAEDFTVVAGTIAAGSNAKRFRLAELALQERVPLIMILEGAGYRPTERSHGRAPTDLLMQAVFRAGSGGHRRLGPSAGHGALIAPMSDFTVMSEQGAIFTRAARGAGVPRREGDQGGSRRPRLWPWPAGSSTTWPRTTARLDQVRQYLSFFRPARGATRRARRGPTDTASQRAPLDHPRESRRVYDMRRVIDVLVDDGDWFEIQPGFGPAVIVGLARLGGAPVRGRRQSTLRAGRIIDAEPPTKRPISSWWPILPPAPRVSGRQSRDAPRDSTSERAAILRSGAQMFVAQTQATTPKVNVTIRKAYGFGSWSWP